MRGRTPPHEIVHHLETLKRQRGYLYRDEQHSLDEARLEADVARPNQELNDALASLIAELKLRELAGWWWASPWRYGPLLVIATVYVLASLVMTFLTLRP